MNSLFLFIFLLPIGCSDTNFSESSGKKDVIKERLSPDKSMDSNPNNPVITESLDIPDDSITKGVYTIWTEPSDPRPFENYFVYIRISKPINVNQLEGSLIGTDTYEECYGAMNTGRDCYVVPEQLTAPDGNSLFRTYVPGSFMMVEDTINVKIRDTDGENISNDETVKIVF